MSVADCEGHLPRRSGARPRYPSSLTCGNDGGPISPFGPLGFFRSFRGVLRGCERPPANPFKARIPGALTNCDSRSPTTIAAYRYPDMNIPFEIKRRIEYYYLIPVKQLRWRNQSLPCNMWMMIPGAGSSAPNAGCDSSVSPRGRNTLRVTGGDPNGSRPACEPGGRARLSGSSRTSWVARRVLWPSKPWRTRRGRRGFPLDWSQIWPELLD